MKCSVTQLGWYILAHKTDDQEELVLQVSVLMNLRISACLPTARHFPCGKHCDRFRQSSNFARTRLRRWFVSLHASGMESSCEKRNKSPVIPNPHKNYHLRPFPTYFQRMSAMRFHQCLTIADQPGAAHIPERPDRHGRIALRASADVLRIDASSTNRYTCRSLSVAERHPLLGGAVALSTRLVRIG
jgi:hypothetical protein